MILQQPFIVKTKGLLPKQNYLLRFTIDAKPCTAVFVEMASGLFDLRYGWTKWVERPRDSLSGILKDFSLHLKKYYPGATIQMTDPIKITESEARSYSNVPPSGDETPPQ